MQYSSQHSLTSCYGAHSLAPSFLRSLASSVMLSGDAAIMPDLPSSLVAHCEADFMRISCVMWAIHSQSRNNRHFFALPSPSLSPSSTSSSSSSCACARRGEGRGGGAPYHHLSADLVDLADRPTDRRSTDNNRREKQASHARTTERTPADGQPSLVIWITLLAVHHELGQRSKVESNRSVRSASVY